jgi:Outer membrane lipoprotein carrier protein LolA
VIAVRLPLLSRTNLVLLLCVLWAVLAGCAGKGSLSEINLDRVLEDAEKKSSIVNRFRTEFVKTRQSSIFSRPLTVEGTLIFQKPNKFRLTITGDVNVEIVSDGKLVALTHDMRDREVYPAEGSRDLSAFADPLMIFIRELGKGALKKSGSGAIKRIKLRFTNGDFDDITFRSWTMLARNAPEILDLHERLNELPERRTSGGRTADAPEDGAVSKH